MADLKLILITFSVKLFNNIIINIEKRECYNWCIPL